MKLFHYISMIGVIALSLITTGCTSQNPQFFILNPAKFSNIQNHKACRKIIVITDVKIPKYLDKPQIITRVNANQLIEAEFYRWAEPLNDNILSAVKQNLSLQLKRDIILSFPLTGISRVSYYLAIKIKQFEVNAAGTSILNVAWSLTNKNSKSIIYKESTYSSHSNDPNNYANIVIAMNQNITELSQDIADQLSRLACTS
jgi:uncharacterized lipoprotein YmbA